MSIKFDHLGHVVRNLDEGIKLYEKLGLTPLAIMEAPKFGARFAIFRYADTFIELIEPGGKEGDPASRCLKERGEGNFHICFATDDYDAEVKALRNKGVTVEEYHLEGVIPGQTLREAYPSVKEMHGLWMNFVDASLGVSTLFNEVE
jgi:catechol 2,3-dioxygenase-like lactoylglutathione lyase family enzyme